MVQYTGAKSNTKDDEMCIKAQSVKIAVSEQTAAKLLQEALSQMKASTFVWARICCQPASIFVL